MYFSSNFKFLKYILIFSNFPKKLQKSVLCKDIANLNLNKQHYQLKNSRFRDNGKKKNFPMYEPFIETRSHLYVVI